MQKLQKIIFIKDILLHVNLKKKSKKFFWEVQKAYLDLEKTLFKGLTYQPNKPVRIGTKKIYFCIFKVLTPI